MKKEIKSITTEEEYVKELIKMRTKLSLDEKIQFAINRIRHFYNSTAFHTTPAISFSGGLDSSVMLHLVRSEFKHFPAVFFDTGVEYIELKKFVKNTPNLIIKKPEKNFIQVCNEYGIPAVSKTVAHAIAICQRAKEAGVRCETEKYFDPEYKSLYNCSKYKYLIDCGIKIGCYCCDVLKKNPVKKSHYSVFVGTKMEDSILRRNVLLNNGGCFFARKSTLTPIAYFTEQDVLEYILLYDVPYCRDIYGDIKTNKNGKLTTSLETHTGCKCCLFGIFNDRERIIRLRKKEPLFVENLFKYTQYKQLLDLLKIEY